jgi:drug/metabolite transporter (DMT)-like permease
MTVGQQSDGTTSSANTGDVQARLMLLTLCLIWGLTWPAMKIALYDMPPLTMRTLTAAFGGLSLLAICFVRRRSLRIRPGKDWAHVIAASLLNVVGFSLFSAFAQIATATSRVAMLTYIMPIWTLVLAWAVLGDRPTRMQSIAIVLCAIGVTILVFPLAKTGVPLGLLLALLSGFSWAAGTVYLKWAQPAIDPLGLATWQVIIAFVIVAASMLIFDGRLEVEHAHAGAWIGVLFSGIAGNAIAYALWFYIVGRVTALTATLGIVGIPVLGVLSTVIIIGERPTEADAVGFAFIFAASVCAQIPPSVFRQLTGRSAAPIRQYVPPSRLPDR